MGGGDKSLMQLGGRTILDHVVERVRPQVAELLINANGDPARFADFKLPVVADVVPDFAGPLAGVLTGMGWVADNAAEVPWLASFATDAPFLPLDLVARMLAAIDKAGAEMACATSAGRAHPVFGIWPVRLRDELRRAMEDEEIRKIDHWTARYKIVHVAFDGPEVDPFFNVNRPENLAEAEAMAGAS